MRSDLKSTVTPPGAPDLMGLHREVVTFVATEEEIGGNKPFPLTVIGWSSRKLTRICRSTQQPKRR